MSHLIGGCCALCDVPCFEVEARWSEGEKRAGDPKALGKPMNDSVRVAFLLFGGSWMALTFCGPCAGKLAPSHYTLLWRRNLAGYLREQDGNPEKFKTYFENGLLCELGRQEWKEIAVGR